MNTLNQSTPAVMTPAEEIQELRLLARTVGLTDKQTARFRELLAPAAEAVSDKLEAVSESRVTHAKALEEIEARLDAPLLTPFYLRAYFAS